MMTNLLLAFVLLAMAMYIGVRVVDLVIARFNLFPNKDRVDSVNCYPGDLPSDFNCSSHPAQVIHNCDLETICAEVTENAEGISEGISTIAEVAGEHIATVLEGLQ